MMIERNLGNVERVLRLLAGLAMAIWALAQPNMNGIELFVMATSVMLIMNGIFSRCYLWFVLDINSCAGDKQDCEKNDSSC
jgi:hypothetical protein|tara:strand:+ start:1970 stop:2212 length:243 start_codon:yes stop_codon:yes gene_type:complete